MRSKIVRDRDYNLDNDYECNKCKHPCPKKILLECGTVGGTKTLSTECETFIIASITVDTSCFCKPITELQFSSQVMAEIGQQTTTTAEVELHYDLICQRKCGNEVCIGTYKFSRFSGSGLATNIKSTDTFNFNKCICPSPCTGCVTYFVRVTATTVTDNSCATVSMGQLIAKIQDY